MSPQMLRERLIQTIDRLDRALIALAIVNIGLYLLELLTVWDQLGVRWLYEPLMLACDLVFVADLLAKLAVHSRYLRSPWFAIDFLSCLPILSVLASVPLIGPGLRFIRMLRILRALRILRVLRSVSVIGAIPGADEEEFVSVRFQRSIFVLVILSALALVGLTNQIRLLATTPQQAEFMEAILLLGALMGISLTLLLLQLQLPKLTTARIRSLVQVALPQQIVDRLLSDPGVYRRTSRQPASVIFCDIVGFTQTVEKLDGDLDALKAHLERSLNAVTDEHLRYDLIIDKFIGDAVMSFRGGELVEGTPQEHAVAVVRAAMDSQSAMWALDDPYFRDLKIGGASSDAALIGAFGTSRRLTYTVLGDRVNLAARLEAAVKQCGTSNLFCKRTHALTMTCPDIRWRRFGWLRVQGKEEPVEVFEALDPSWETDWSWLAHFHAALELFEAGDLAAAALRFQDADSARSSGDLPSQRYRRRALEGNVGPFRTEK